MKRTELRRLATSVREVIQSLLREKSPISYSEYGDADNLGGACGCASWALWQVLPHSSLVLGKFEDCTHCWVEYNEYIIDITATQFGLEPVRLLLKRGKSGHLYKKDQWDREVVEALDDWYPNNWRREVSSRLERNGLLERRAA